MICDQCHGEIVVHAIIDSDIWEVIARDAYALCPPCIDSRLVQEGLVAECDLQFSGAAMRSIVTPRVQRAGAWRPRERIAQERRGLPSLFGKQ